VCDPVLGDNNQYYVPVALVETFKTELIPRYMAWCVNNLHFVPDASSCI